MCRGVARGVPREEEREERALTSPRGMTSLLREEEWREELSRGVPAQQREINLKKKIEYTYLTQNFFFLFLIF